MYICQNKNGTLKLSLLSIHNVYTKEKRSIGRKEAFSTSNKDHQE